MTSQVTNNIDGEFPIAGQDNDSQGFRDNFTNIGNNFTQAATEISDLQTKGIFKSALDNTALNNDMIYEKITRPQLNSYSESFYSIGSGSTINYELGNTQKITTGGNIILEFANWPPSNQLGKVTLWLEVSSVAHTLTLPAECSIGFPELLSGAVVNADNTVTITFGATGYYFYEFKTVNNGDQIYAKQV